MRRCWLTRCRTTSCTGTLSRLYCLGPPTRAVSSWLPCLSPPAFSGAYHPGKHVTGPWRTSNSMYSPDYLEQTRELAETMGEVARAHDATAAQVALTHVLRHPNVVAIPGAVTADQLAENAEAVDLALDHESRALAEAASRCPALGAHASKMRPWVTTASPSSPGMALSL